MIRPRKAKIVATLGPATSDLDTITQLFNAGADVFRLNFSHGDYVDHEAAYKRIRRIEFYELPKTISGKIRRVELRKTEEARGSDTRRENEYWEEDFGA